MSPSQRLHRRRRRLHPSRARLGDRARGRAPEDPQQYYLETRCDVLLRNREVFEYWRRLGLTYLFLGLEAIDEKD